MLSKQNIIVPFISAEIGNLAFQGLFAVFTLNLLYTFNALIECGEGIDKKFFAVFHVIKPLFD